MSIREKSVEALGKEYPDYFIKKVSIESQKDLHAPQIQTIPEKSETPNPFPVEGRRLTD